MKKTVFENINLSNPRGRRKKSAKENSIAEKMNFDLKPVGTKQASAYNLRQHHLHLTGEKPRKKESRDSEGDYAKFMEHKFEGTVSSPEKTREDQMDDYRLEQRFLDESYTENTEVQPSFGNEEQMKKLGNIKEETAESHSSEEGKYRVTYVNQTHKHVKGFDKNKNKAEIIRKNRSIREKFKEF